MTPRQHAEETLAVMEAVIGDKITAVEQAKQSLSIAKENLAEARKQRDHWRSALNALKKGYVP